MLFVLGLLVVIGSVLGGYLPHGDLAVLWQPFEVLIILGAAIGAFIIANPVSVQLGLLRNLKILFRGAPYPKEAYLELLTLLFTMFKLARSKGLLALESHLDDSVRERAVPPLPAFHRQPSRGRVLVRLLAPDLARRREPAADRRADDRRPRDPSRRDGADRGLGRDDERRAAGLRHRRRRARDHHHDGRARRAAGGARPTRRLRARRHLSRRAARLWLRGARGQQAARLLRGRGQVPRVHQGRPARLPPWLCAGDLGRVRAQGALQPRAAELHRRSSRRSRTRRRSASGDAPDAARWHAGTSRRS